MVFKKAGSDILNECAMVRDFYSETNTTECNIHFCVRETSMIALFEGVHRTRSLFYWVVFFKETLSWLEENLQIHSTN